MPKVSVIVPIYGVENFIERCVRSLFSQTLDDIEFIFVDDCTKDRSIEILETVIEDYPERKGQIKILHHEENRGLPQARKTGILEAQGDFIANCDSDDWVDSHYYETMYLKAISDDSDIVVSDFSRANGKDKSKYCIGAHTTIKSKYERNLFLQKDTWAVWNKIARKELYKDIIYPVVAQAEDMVFTLQLINKCKRISYVRDVYYYYFFNSSSMTKVNTLEKTIERFNAMASNIEIVKSIYSKRGCNYFLGYLEFLHKSGLHRNINSSEIRKLFCLKMWDLLYLLDIRIKIKVKMAYIYSLMFKMFC